ncbi:hypothetical protein [Treponema brennaborense]|uniref:Uncharacterized protein n=1 Tax=Treponema brennaborense (strain DSM 12168 / CIP 105900 / DD5/3) TaxID=906968 RepID=F4LK83_TREBD|nr:hypothetical protein [Treponema brennaborense]AEE15472.1 hypothetical protein Trebr_0012 [Treponema brennaborense DSM 12168]
MSGNEKRLIVPVLLLLCALASAAEYTIERKGDDGTTVSTDIAVTVHLMNYEIEWASKSDPSNHTTYTAGSKNKSGGWKILKDKDGLLIWEIASASETETLAAIEKKAGNGTIETKDGSAPIIGKAGYTAEKTSGSGQIIRNEVTVPIPADPGCIVVIQVYGQDGTHTVLLERTPSYWNARKAFTN